MGDGAVNTSTIKVAPVDWNRPVADKTIATGNTVSQVQNPDVTVSVSTNPITPPNMIVAKATQETAQVGKVEAIRAIKPEFVMDISKYFQTIYLDLEEDNAMLFTQAAIMLNGYKENNTTPLPTMKQMLGRPKTKEEYSALGKKLLDSPEIKKAFKYTEQFGISERGKLPEWLSKKIELLSKRHVFLYASHKDLEDFGMDMDYLTIPMIDKTAIVPEPLRKQFPGYNNYPQILYLNKYDNLLTEYNGVSTVGKLGRELSISGVELYNLWKELNKAGVVTTYNWEHKNNKGAVTAKTAKKWLEVASDINVIALMASIDVNPSIKPKLEKYLLTLQQGKKRDDSFFKSYEKLKLDYNKQVLIFNYYTIGFQVLEPIGVEYNNENLQKYYAPKADKWIKEYEYFSVVLKGALACLAVAKSENAMAWAKDNAIKMLEEYKEGFEGENLPVGQEFLFDLSEELDSFPPEKTDKSIYTVKYK